MGCLLDRFEVRLIPLKQVVADIEKGFEDLLGELVVLNVGYHLSHLHHVVREGFHSLEYDAPNHADVAAPHANFLRYDHAPASDGQKPPHQEVRPVDLLVLSYYVLDIASPFPKGLN